MALDNLTDTTKQIYLFDCRHKWTGCQQLVIFYSFDAVRKGQGCHRCLVVYLFGGTFMLPTDACFYRTNRRFNIVYLFFREMCVKF